MIERIKKHLSITNAPLALVIAFSLAVIIVCASSLQGVTA
jgi:hypothetical protein